MRPRSFRLRPLGTAAPPADHPRWLAGAALCAAILGLLAPAAPAAGQRGAPSLDELPPRVRVTSRIVTVDREALARAGLEYVVLGNDRVRVTARGRREPRGVGIEVGTHGVSAFLSAARENRWVRSEATQQVLAMSGRPARVSSTDVSTGGRWGVTRTQGPSLEVVPTVLPDGSVHLQVWARIEDSVRGAWGYGADGGPASVETELVVPDGEEVLLASSSSNEEARRAGLLGWGSSERGRDVLVAVTAEVVR